MYTTLSEGAGSLGVQGWQGVYSSCLGFGVEGRVEGSGFRFRYDGLQNSIWNAYVAMLT